MKSLVDIPKAKFGTSAPRSAGEEDSRRGGPKQASKIVLLCRSRFFWAIVFIAVPTFASAIYYSTIAADQFQTVSLISIRSSQASGAGSLLGSFFGLGNISQSAIEANTVSQFIKSHDAVKKLDEKLDLKTIYSVPEDDFLARLAPKASFEELVDYYDGMVDATFDPASGITTIKVRAFRTEDAMAISRALLRISEELVNSFNARAEKDSLHLAQSELEKAAGNLATIRQQMTDFRVLHQEINPSSSTEAIGTIIASLSQQYAETSTSLSEAISFMNPDSLQVEVLRKRLRALKKQIDEEKKILTGSEGAMPDVLASYEVLVLNYELASLAYKSAIGSLESARIEAQGKRSYVVEVVSPHVADEAIYPRKLRNVFFVLVGSFVIFGIGRMMFLGIRDHVMH
jgi:capsular polysaccharide transport system permease protein